MAFIDKQQPAIDLGYILVAILAVGNGGGRILAGTLSDKFGRKATLSACFTMQAFLMILLSRVTIGNTLAAPVVLAIISALIGANYGANLALFPAITKDFYGFKNFGINYGMVFTAWGAGGFVLPLLAGKIFDAIKSFTLAYYGAATVLVAAALITFALRKPTALAFDSTKT